MKSLKLHPIRFSVGLSALVLLLAMSGCALFGIGDNGDSGERWEPTYEVEAGDTLYSISFAHGLDYRELAAWNDIGPPYQIKVGEKLRLTAPDGFVYTPPADTRVASRASGKSAVAKSQSGKPANTDGSKTGSTNTSSKGNTSGETPVFTRDDDENPPLQTAKAEPPTTTLPGVVVPPVVVPGANADKTGTAAPASTSTTPTPPDDNNDTAQSTVENLKWRWPLRGDLLRMYAPDTGSAGIDIGGTAGQQVRAAASGKVVYGGSGLQGYGLLVIVKHDDNYLSAYAYNRKLLVQQGDEVHIGQPIAEMGEGPQRKPLLHFEIRRAGKTVDPLQILPAKP